MNFNPRTPCGVRRADNSSLPLSSIISIHAPRAGCDRSTGKLNLRTAISIHAPRAGCDVVPKPLLLLVSNFNPRTPCGVRQERFGDWCAENKFQSTHPVRGATLRRWCMGDGLRFQSTHPVRGATCRTCFPQRPESFQSTHPVRGATV